MKATTLIIMLVLIGVVLDLNPIPNVSTHTLGNTIITEMLPSELGGGSAENWKTLVAVGAGVMAIGVILLGQKVPYATLLTFFMGFMFLPIDILTSPDVAMPAVAKTIFGVIWLGMFLSAGVTLFRSEG